MGTSIECRAEGGASRSEAISFFDVEKANALQPARLMKSSFSSVPYLHVCANM